MFSTEIQLAENSAGANAAPSAGGKQNALPPHGGSAASQPASAAKAKDSAHAGAAKKSAAAQPDKTQMKTGIEHQAKSPFPPFDSTYYASNLLWLAISFGFFYFFMARVVLPRLGGVIEMRRDRIAADLDQAARMKSESDAAVAAYQKNLAEARDRAKSIARTAAEEAKIKASAERKSAEAEIEQKLAELEQKLAGSRDAALTHIGAMAERAAADIVERLSGKKADSEFVARAVNSAAAAKTNAGGAVS